MIILRAPLRISFVGGGTDISDFYKMSPGRVISTTIDKYVYVVINSTPLIKKVTVRYSVGESVDFAKELKNDRVREALLDLGIENNIEIGTFSHLPVGTGLGGSSSFSVALMKGLYAVLGKRIDKREAAEAACRLEIDLVKEPIGKQDQYAAAFGGFNVFQFNSDETVNVEPVLLDYKKRLGLEDHMILFFTGITRSASNVLIEQKANTSQKIDTLKEMADSVFLFRERLLSGDFKSIGEMLHQGWMKKKSLASKISNNSIDEMYNAGIASGAWGGKVLGAGGGGCILFIVSPEKKEAIRQSLKVVAHKNGLGDFKEVPVKFTQAGVEILSVEGVQIN
jgi:D-glycero-alpha-D-manno-heptose-7-phosphate kinase